MAVAYRGTAIEDVEADGFNGLSACLDVQTACCDDLPGVHVQGARSNSGATLLHFQATGLDRHQTVSTHRGEISAASLHLLAR